MGDEVEMPTEEEGGEFLHWLLHGVSKGWISQPFCAMHDLPPMTDEENEAMEEGWDPCQPSVRLWSVEDWQDQATRAAVAAWGPSVN